MRVWRYGPKGRRLTRHLALRSKGGGRKGCSSQQQPTVAPLHHRMDDPITLRRMCRECLVACPCTSLLVRITWLQIAPAQSGWARHDDRLRASECTSRRKKQASFLPRLPSLPRSKQTHLFPPALTCHLDLCRPPPPHLRPSFTSFLYTKRLVAHSHHQFS